MEKHLIVGLDPGTSVGLAMLDVDGNVILVKSARNMPVDEIITEIASIGKATVVATDKAVAPAMVTKLSSILGARLFTPDTDLQVERKRELASRFPTQNDHERDSLAAAVYAYYNFQNKIRRVEKQVLEQLEEIKARVLKGEKVSDILEPVQEEDKERELLAQISALRRENRGLKEALESLSRARPKEPHEILRAAAKEARELVKDVARGKLAILREVPSLKFLDLKNLPIKSGDFVICRGKDSDSMGIRFLEGRRVGAIISRAKIESLAPTCAIEDVAITSWEGLFFADPLDIKKACGRRREVKARDLHDMLLDYKKGRI